MNSNNVLNMVEIPISRELMEQILANVPTDTILVGGQALAFWIEHFNIDPRTNNYEDEAYVSMDADFLGRREHVQMLAEAVSGVVDYPPERAMTILCGQIFVFDKDKKSFMNIDVIHRFGNLDTEAIRQRSVQANLDGKTFFVIHPLDVLLSRVENYRSIRDKQSDNGLRQVELAVKVAENYVIELAGCEEKKALRAIERIAEIGRSAAGLLVREQGVEIYNAISPQSLAGIIKNENFLSVRLPRLEDEISDITKMKGTFTGKVLSINNEKLIQNLGRKTLVHRVENFDSSPLVSVGDRVQIAYDKQGRGTVTAIDKIKTSQIER